MAAIAVTSLAFSRTPRRVLYAVVSAQTRPEKILVSGGRQLSGHVSISGSKNSALAILAGTLCCSGGQSLLRGMPGLSDMETMAEILRSLGASVEDAGGGDLLVDSSGVHSVEPSADLMGRIRAGFFVLGPLAARFGEADVALPGGCKIGARPVDLYVRGLSALGMVVKLRLVFCFCL